MRGSREVGLNRFEDSGIGKGFGNRKRLVGCIIPFAILVLVGYAVLFISTRGSPGAWLIFANDRRR